MKHLIFSLFTALILFGQGTAQNIYIDAQTDHTFDYDININPDFEIDFDFDFDISTDFDFNFDFPIYTSLNSFSYPNSEWNLERDKSRDGPSIKEKINFSIGSDEYNSDTEVVIKNINGELKVSGYDGDEIKVTGTKELWKKRGDVSDEEANEFSLQTKKYEGKLYIYVDSPNAHVEFEKGRMNYHWHWDDDNKRRVNFNFDLEIKVPKDLALKASTVNGGDLFIENMRNGVHANNVNGAVTVKDVKGYTTANTVNGDIKVWFLESPKEDTDFQTVNGTIEIFSPADLSAIVTFESLHGELYTDFEQVKRLPNRLNKEKDGDGYRYRINKTSPVQIGDGAIEIGFKMVNGDAYIRTRKS